MRTLPKMTRTKTHGTLAASQVRHWDGKIHSAVGEGAQDLHVGKLVVEAEEDGLHAGAENARLRAFPRPSAAAVQEPQRAFVLQ